MNKKIVWIITLVGLLAGTGVYLALNQKITNFEECTRAGYLVMESFPAQCRTPDGKHFVEEISPDRLPSPVPITISGEITCLPKSGQGPQTMECAIGLRGTDGQYYGLKNLSKFDPEYKFSTTGLQVAVSGMFSQQEIKASEGMKYNVVGTIDLISIK